MCTLLVACCALSSVEVFGYINCVLDHRRSMSFETVKSKDALEQLKGATDSIDDKKTSSTDSPQEVSLIKSLRAALTSFDQQKVIELIGNAPYLATAVMNRRKLYNGLHELVLAYTSGEALPNQADTKLAELVKILVEHGVDINDTDIQGNTPLFFACNQPGYTECIRALVNAGAKVNKQNHKKQTALHWVVAGGWEDDIEAVLEGDADPDVVDSKRHSPLHLAVKQRHPATLLKLLVHHGASINLQDNHLGNQGPTPLHLAVKAGRLEGVKQLLQLGARTDLVDSSGLTPLHLASIHNTSDDIARCLITHKADINAKDDLYGETPLHKAIKHDMFTMVNILVCSGAKVNIQNFMLDTPLHLAAVKITDLHTWNLLIRYGGDLRIKNQNGFNCMVKAHKCKNKEALLILKQYHSRLTEERVNLEVKTNSSRRQKAKSPCRQKLQND